jgi:tetratricopeptide (TPR) repeat protein
MSPPPETRLKSACAGGAIVLMVLLAYLPALRGGFVWDDDSWTFRIAALLRDTSGLREIWVRPTAMQQYYPLSGTSFWLDYQLWKFWPAPYHVENVLLHALSALLFWRLLRQLEVAGAWVASAVFALHPIMVESAAWITERKNVLSLALCLGAALAYQRHACAECRKTDQDAAHGAVAAGSGSLPYVVALLLFVGALLAKTTVCTFPAAVLLITWWRRGQLRLRRDVLPTLPFFAAALAMGAVTFWMEKHHAGAQGAAYALSMSQRFLIAGRAFWFYLGKLLWPANLCFIYPRWQPNVGEWTQWLYPATALGVLLGLWLAKGRIGRGPVTALLFFAGTLFPLLGFFNVYFMRYSFVCDHWVYLPSLAPIALAAFGLSKLHDYLGGARLLKFAMGGVLLLALGLLTWKQAGTYATMESLWRNTIDGNPDSWMAHNSLGNALFRTGKTNAAISEFEQAIRLKPDLAEAYTSLGVALNSKGQLDDGMARFQDAIRVQPDYAEAHYDLAIAFQQKGQIDDAIIELQEAVRLKPYFAAAQRRLSSLVKPGAR